MTELLASSLLWTAATLAAFQGADLLSRKSGRHPLCHPVLLATPVLIGLLAATRTAYETYHSATLPLRFLLGPAVVGLAVPIWARRALIRQMALPVATALAAGSITAVASAYGILSLFGAPEEILASIAPRSTTTPVAMELATLLGGIPALAAVLALSSGILGAMVGPFLFRILKIGDMRARGFAMGVASHGIGTARAFEEDATMGSFSALAMALNALATAVLLSLLALVG